MIASASNEIAMGNYDLSTRTEEQASSLQQTPAAMEESTTTVRLDIAHAQQANKLAEMVSGIVAQGGHSVSQVMHAMSFRYLSAH